MIEKFKKTRTFQKTKPPKKTKIPKKLKTEKNRFRIIIELITLIVSIFTCISTFLIQNNQNQISRNQNKFEQQMNLSGNNKKDDLKTLMKIVSDVESLDSFLGSLNSLNKDYNEKLVEIRKDVISFKNSFYYYLDQDNKEWKELDKVLTDKLNLMYSRTSPERSSIGFLPHTGGDDSILEEKWTNYIKQEKTIIENIRTIR